MTDAEKGFADDQLCAQISRNNRVCEPANAGGSYSFACHDCHGNLKWTENVKNVVTTLGGNLLLDTLLGGSGYTVTGPYIGLISSASYASAPVAADTMASHTGWREAGIANAPTYGSGRKAVSFSSAAAKAKASSADVSFTFTGAGTVKGSFLALGSGAVSTVDNTSGTLYSAGLFALDRVVIETDVLTVGYNASV